MGIWYEKLNPSDEIFKLNKKKKKLDVNSVTSYLVQKYVKDGNNHPAKDFPRLFNKEFPDNVLTYEWSKGMGNEKGLLGVLKDQRVQRALSSDRKRTGGSLLVWIDVFFIDQLSKNVKVELAISQEYYILCENHIIAGSITLLDRGWCVWELSLRAHSKKNSLVIGELEAKERGYDFFSNMKLFDPDDRPAIEMGLCRVFGWGDEGIVRINRAIAAQGQPKVGSVPGSAGSWPVDDGSRSEGSGFRIRPVGVGPPQTRESAAMFYCWPPPAPLGRPGDSSALQLGLRVSVLSPPPARANTCSIGGGDGLRASTRLVALGQDAGGLPAETGLTYADFRAVELAGHRGTGSKG
eukprot:CAMPEP_0172198658 /NCGR_PEP_ID=MMETSP1050-20130122/28220_1 /TAXON_ID=233186 /ORGANISM="Cryptomonas curvata, Strain CCAP979/52" /LENGTH=350 /DNA_ID=CAMNT_0012875525 /DNA_START=353 /DNA_END=1405 /DNA_ORIENTATION=-